VKPNVASAFKATCLERGESQASVLSKAMLEYADAPPPKQTKTAKKAITYDTLGKRRKAVNELVNQLHSILAAEEDYRDSIPENFVTRIESAEESIEYLTDALENLESVYT